METPGINTIIEVEKCLLTKDAIYAIRNWQDSNNEVLENDICIIADVICYIAFNLDELINKKEKEKGIDCMKKLSILRTYIERMRKP